MTADTKAPTDTRISELNAQYFQERVYRVSFGVEVIELALQLDESSLIHYQSVIGANE
jgi:hypothetical protein